MTARTAGGASAAAAAALLACLLAGWLPAAARAQTVCDLGYGLLNFNYTNTDLSYAGSTTKGKALNDRVLYKSVASKTCNGVTKSIDAVVTTKALSSSSVSVYESGAHACVGAGCDEYFQVDTGVSAANGYAEFEFRFYISGTYNNANPSANQVTLQNVKVTGIDIDSSQFNDFTAVEAYTVLNGTRLQTPAAYRSPASGFPANIRFQAGTANNYNNAPEDQVTVAYGSITTFSVRFGNTVVQSTNYFGVLFKELGWPAAPATTISYGTPYPVTYDANGGGAGTVPTSPTKVLGETVTVAGNTGGLTKPGYTFGGWNTAPDGSGTSYAAGSTFFQPVNGEVLYAIWTPGPLAAANDAYTGAYNTPLVVGAAQSIFNNDGPGPDINVTQIVTDVPASDGTLALDFDTGAFVFMPARGFRGNTSFVYKITNGGATQPTATVTITIPGPLAVTAANDAYTAAFNTPFSPPAGQLLLANDASPNANPQLQVVSNGPLSNPAAGTLSAVGSDGNFTFVPASGFSGNVTFNYTMTDKDTGLTATATATITVAPPAPPAAGDDAFACAYGVACAVPAGQGLLANDVGTGLAVDNTTQPTASVGSVTVNPDGSFTWTPPGTGYSGNVTFTYTAKDSAGQTATATVTLVVAAPAPLAPAQLNYTATYNTDFPGPVSLLDGLNSSNPGAQLSVVGLTTQPPASVGTVTVSPNGTWTFVPATGWYGDTQFCANVTDGAVFTTVCVNIRVDPPVPAANDDVFTCTYGTPCTVPAGQGLLANDAGVSLAVDNTTQPTASVGTVAVNPDGSFTWTPPGTGYSGNVTFTYTVVDGAGQAATATVTLVVAAPAPLAPAQLNYTATYNTDFPGPVSLLDGLNSSNPGAQLSVVGLTTQPPANVGTVMVSPNGTWTFVPATGWYGDTQFCANVTDGAVFTTVCVNIRVDPPAPAANDDVFTCTYGTPCTVPAGQGLLANDAGVSLAVDNTTQPTASVGSVAVNPDGSFIWTPPGIGFSGNVTFTYTVVDGAGQTATATVTLVVAAPAPLAPAQLNYTATYNTDFPGPVTLLDGLNSSNPGAQLSVVGLTTQPPANEGTVTVSPNGTWTFVPATGWYGDTQFCANVTDGAVFTTVCVNIRVDPPAPAANDDVFTCTYGTPCTVPAGQGLLANDAGVSLAVDNTTQPTASVGSVAVNPDGSFIWTPPGTGFSGNVTFTYTVVDGAGQTATATVTLVVAAPAPLAPAQLNYTATYNTDFPGPVSLLDGLNSSNPGAQLSVVGLTTQPPANEGTVTVSPNGTWTFVPATGWYGDTQFCANVTDGAVFTTVCVNIRVDPPAPAANDDVFTCTYGTPCTVPAGQGLLANDAGVSLAVDNTTQPTASVGTVAVNPDGSFTWTPPGTGYSGNVTFTYTVVDGAGQTATATVTLVVAAPAPLAPAQLNYTATYNTDFPGPVSLLDGLNSSNPGAQLSVVGLTTQPPANEGTVTVSPNGTWTFVPATGWYGDTQFCANVTDGAVFTTVCVNIRVDPPAPAANDDVFTCTYGTPCTVPAGQGLLANDAGVSLAVDNTTQSTASVGTVTVNPDGSFTWTPPGTGHAGNVTFTYTVTDGAGQTATATVTLVVPPPTPLPPVVLNYTAPYNQSFTGPASLLDGLNSTVPGGTLQVVGVTTQPPANEGTVTVSPNGTFVFTPADGWHGETQFCANITDGATSTTACVTIKVDPPSPVANDDAYTCTFGQGCSVSAADGILANDNSSASGAISIVGTPTPSAGTLTVNPDGSFDWTPPSPVFSGSVTFTYTITDATGHQDTATVTLVVPPPPPSPPLPPLVFNYTGDYNQNFTGPTSLLDGLNNTTNGTLTVIDVISKPPPGVGDVEVSPNGSYVFKPADGFVGETQFCVNISDGGVKFRTACVKIKIPPPTPVARDDSYVCAAGKTCSVAAADGILANDTANGTLSIVGTPATTTGALTVNPDGSFDWTPPSPDFSGTVTFTYTVEDATGNQDTATATLVVLPPLPPLVFNYTGEYNKPFTGPVSLLDGLNSTVPGGTLQVVAVTTQPPANEGTVTVSPNGTFVFTPVDGFTGDTQFCANITDGVTSTTACVTITVPAPSPVANDDSYSCPPGGTCSISAAKGVLANDNSSPPGPLTIVAVSPASAGTVTVNPDGSFDWVPPASGFSGDVTFTYTVEDSAGNQATATVTLNVPAVPLVAKDDVFTGQFDQPLVLTLPESVLANDGPSPTGANLSVVAFNLGDLSASGTVSDINLQAGTFTFTPNPGFSGDVTFTYSMTDGVSPDQPTAAVTIKIPAAPAPLIANDDVYTCAGGGTCSIPVAQGVLANDVSPGGLDLIIVDIPQDASAGTLTVNPDGSFDWTPPSPDFSGNVTFKYTVMDANGNQATATVTLVAPTPLVAKDDVYTGQFNKPLVLSLPQSVLANDGPSPTGANLSVVAFNLGDLSTSGTVSDINLQQGTFTFTPIPGFIGNVTFTYSITDGVAANQPTATVTIVIRAPQLVVANDDVYMCPSGKPCVVPALQGVLANDASPGNLTLTVVGTPSTNDGVVAVKPDGSFEWVPPSPDFSGNVAFTYTVEDTAFNQATATVTLVVPTPLVAKDDVYTGQFDKPLVLSLPQSVLANDGPSPTGAPLSVVAFDLSGLSASGTVSDVNLQQGTFTFTPNPGFSGTATFSYSVTDGVAANQPTATVTIVIPAPALVIAKDDAYVALFNAPFSPPAGKKLLANDSSDNPNSQLEVTGTGPLSDPAAGNLTRVDPDGNFVFVPATGWTGTVTFTYTVTDKSTGLNATATARVTVQEQPAPVANDDVYTCEAGKPCVVPAPQGVLANDASPANLTLTVVGTPTVSAGTLVVNPDGSFQWTPPSPGFSGNVTFTYTVSDGAGNQDTATVTLVVPAPPKPLVAADDVYTGKFDKPLVLFSAQSVLANDGPSPTGAPLSVVAFNLGDLSASGTVSNINLQAGTFTFTPNPGFSGSVNFTYSITDGVAANQPTATVTIIILAPAPVIAKDDAYTAAANQPFSPPANMKLLANDSSANPKTQLEVTGTGPLSDLAAGNLTRVDPDGNFVFVPATGFSGTVTFTYTVTDKSSGLNATATASITVTPPVPTPVVCVADTFNCTSDGTCNVPAPGVLGNDIGKGPLKVINYTQPAVGNLSVGTNGSVTYTPPIGYQGNVTFNYTAGDDSSTPGTGTVTIVVTPPTPVVCVTDTFNCTSDGTCNVPAPGVLGNDVGKGPLKVINHTQPAVGNVSVGSNGSVTYTPPTGYQGNVTFNYTAGGNGSSPGTGTVTIVVTPPTPVVCVADNISCYSNGTCNVPAPGVLGNDIGKGPLKVINFTQPEVGNLSVGSNGSVTYTPPSGYQGNVTFNYTASDNSSTGTGTVTIVVTRVTMITPYNYTFETPFETPLSATQSSNLLADVTVIVDGQPVRNPKLSVQGLSKVMPASEGTVSVKADGDFVFTPAQGFSGTTEFCVSVLDNQNGGQSQVCVKIIVPPKAPIKIYIPLEPSATGTPAECPDNATMAQIAAEYVAAIKTQPGVLDVVVNRVVCDWLNPTKVLMRVEVIIISKDDTTQSQVLTNINSPKTSGEDQPAGGSCASTLLAGTCGKTVGPVVITGGCATVKTQCMPPELTNQKCVLPSASAGFVTSQPAARSAPAAGDATSQTIPRPNKPKQAQFKGCCVPPGQKAGGGGSTCKAVRVGKKYRDAKTLPQNPLKQISNCECFNLREVVDHDMFTRPNRNHPQHILAPYPFTAGIATKVCAPKAKKSGKAGKSGNGTSAGAGACASQWQTAASAQVSCAAGKISINAVNEKGFVVGELYDVVASCGNSAFTQKSSCGIANSPGTTVTNAPGGGVEVTSPDWDAGCVCKDTGRRPVLKISITDIISGASCQP